MVKRFLNQLFLQKNLFIIAFIFIFLAKFPTLFHYFNTPNGYVFVKQASWFDAWDVNAYVSYIRYGQNYGMMLQNTYTTIPHQGVFVFQLYTFLGIANRLFHLDPFLIFHLTSIIVNVFLVASVFFLIKQLIGNNKDKIPVLLVILLGGGLGFLPQFIGNSAEMVTPDFNFIKPFNIPHDALSILLTIFSLGLFYLFSQTSQKKDIILAVLAGFGSAVFHPYKLLWLILVGFVIAVINKNKFKSLISYPVSLIILFLIYFPFAFYPFINSPGFAGIANEKFINTNPISLLLGLGFLVVPAAWSLFNTDTEKEKIMFVGTILIVQLILLFAPFVYARQFIPTIFVWVALLAYFGIKDMLIKYSYRFALWAGVLLCAISPIYIFFNLLTIKPTNQFYFLTKQEGEMINKANSLPRQSGILSLYRIGNYLPAMTDNKVYFGHYYQTPDSVNTLIKAENFYYKLNEKEQKAFLQDNHIDYIYYGLEEAKVRGMFNLNTDNPFPYFKIVYQVGPIILYSAK